MFARVPAAAAAVVVLLLAGAATPGVCAPAEETVLSPWSAAQGQAQTPAPAEPATPVHANEEPCLRIGGLCVLESECPEGQLAAARGLCPAQEKRGVQCCHGLSILERRCGARGGVCRPKQKCGRSLWEEKAEDCASDETCCVLVS